MDLLDTKIKSRLDLEEVTDSIYWDAIYPESPSELIKAESQPVLRRSLRIIRNEFRIYA
jgi:hypothetical protein